MEVQGTINDGNKKDSFEPQEATKRGHDGYIDLLVEQDVNILTGLEMLHRDAVSPVRTCQECKLIINKTQTTCAVQC